MKKIFLLFNKLLWIIPCWFLLTNMGYSQAITRGTDFWFSLLTNAYQMGPIGLRVYVTSPAGAAGIVEVPGCGFTQNYVCPPGGTIFVQLPPCAEPTSSGVIENKGIHVTASTPSGCYVVNAADYTTDGTIILPVATLGYDYYVTTYKEVYNSIYSEFAVISPFNGVQVEITPTITTLNGWPAGVPQTLTLNQGEMVQVQADGELTGSRVRVITSNCTANPVGVFGGNMCTNVGFDGACDHLYEITLPIAALGTTHVYVPTQPTLDTDIIRILATQNNTIVSIDGVPQPAINAGQYIDFDSNILPGTANMITADKPIAVNQFGKGPDWINRFSGDPMMMALPPENMSVTDVSLSTVDVMPVADHHINITTLTANTGNITVTPAPILCEAWTPVPSNPTYSTCRCEVNVGATSVTSSGGPFLFYMYGWGSSDSYGYAGAGLVLPRPLDVIYSDSICANTTETFTAIFNGNNDPNTDITWDWGDGSPNETGPPATHTVRNHTYTNCGEYTITVTYTSINNIQCTITKIVYVWATPTLTISAPAGLCIGQSGVVTFIVTGTCNGQRPMDIQNNINPNTVPSRIYYKIDNVAQPVLTTFGDGPINFNIGPIVSPITISVDSVVNEYIPWIGPRCSSIPVINSVTVDAYPDPVMNAGSNSPVCVGSTLNLTSDPGGLQSYSWAGPGGFTDNVQNPTRTPVTLAMAGTYTVTGTDAAGCTGTATVTVVVNPQPPVTASSNSPVCEGQTLNLTSSGATTYSWTGPNGFVSSDQNPILTPATLAMAGTYTVVGTDGNGCTNTATVVVVINALPVVTAGSNSPVCEGQTLNLTSAPNGLTTYSWTGPNGFLSGDQNPILTPVTPAMAGTYIVTGTDGNGCSNTASVTVVVTPNIVMNAGSNSPVCEGSTLNLTSDPGGLQSYSWAGPGGFTDNVQNPTRTPVTLAMAGTYTVTGTDAAGCTGTATVTVVVNPQPPVTASSNSPVCEGQTLNLTSSGATTYSWTGPNGFVSSDQNPVLTPATLAMAGTYTVVGTDGNGCTNTATVDVVINALPVVTAGSNSPVCEGQTLNLTSGPNGLDTYSWAGPGGFTDNVQNPTRGSVTPAMAGTYTVTGTDANGCSNTATVTVVVTPNIVMNAGSNSPVCVGSTLNLTSDPGGLQSYSWAGPGGFTDNVQNPTRTPVTLAMAGTYTVTGTDAAGCTGTATVTVVVNPQPPVTASSNSPVCEGQTLNLTSSGATTYSWTGPNGFVSIDQNPVLTPATLAMAGTYTVVGTDGNGCTNTATVDVVINALPIVTAGSNSPVCEGQTLNLTSGPNGLDTYSWAGPGGFTDNVQNPTRGSVTPAMAGTYTVTGTDANGCSNTATVTVVVTPNIVMNAGSNSPVCVGSTLNLTSTPNGLTGYSWAGPGGFTDNVQNPTRTPVTLAMAGTYTVTGTDAAGCTGTATVTVVVNPQPPVTASSNSPVCEGQTLNLTSSGATTYSWTGPNGFVSSDQNPILTPATLAMAGTYTVVGTDGNGCTNTATVDVVINALPIVTAGSNSPVCEGQTLNLTSGPNGLTTYSWTGPNGFLSGDQNPILTPVTPAMAGTYIVTGTDGNGCSNTASVTVVVTPNIVMNAGSNSPVCVGSTLNLTSDPGGLQSYSWAGPAGYTDNVQNPTRTPVTLAMAGTYTVTGTDAAGCTGTATVTVVVNPQPPVTASSNSPVCEGQTLNLTSSGATTYSWTGPNGFVSSDQNPVLTPATLAMAGTYTVVGTDGNGCTNTATVDVVINALPIVTAGSNSPVCEGQTLNLTSGPNGLDTYSWAGPGGFTDNVQNPTRGSVTPAMAGTYTVTGTDANGCSNTATVTVVVTPNIVMNAGSNSPVCVGSTLNLTSTPNGLTGYSWAGPGGFTDNVQNPTRTPVTLAMAGTYTVTGTDAAGCTGTATVTVVVNPQPPVTASSNSPVCEGQTLNLTSSGATTYSWTGPNGFVSSDQNPILTPATLAMAGTYTVVGTDGNGCTNTATVDVVINALPIVTAGSNSPVCEGQTLNLTSGPNGLTTYSWTGPNGFLSGDQNPILTPVTPAMAGTYIVTGTDGNGCSNTASVTVVVTPNIVMNAGSNSPVCVGSTLNLTSDPGGLQSYSWAGPAGYTDNVQNPTRTPVTLAMAGTYTVTGTDAAGCTGTATVTVVVNPQPPVTASSNSPVCEGQTLNLTSGGATTYSWTGPNGFVSSDQNPVLTPATLAMAGTYTVVGTDGNGCTNTATVDVVINALPVVTAGSNSPVCEGQTLNLTSGPNGLDTYSWAGPGGFTDNVQNPTRGSVTPAMAGTYTVTGTDANGCSNTATVTVVVTPNIVMNAGSNSPVCVGSTLNLTSDPGGLQSYSWAGPGGFTDNVQNPTRTPVTLAMAGTYTVTGTDAAGCTGTATVTVVVNPQPNVTASSNSPVCEGQTLNLTSSGATTYSWTGPNGFVSSDQNPVLTPATLAMAGTYTVVGTDGNGCTNTATVDVVINALPVVTAGSNSPVCEGQTLNLTSGPNGLDTYSWAGPGGFTDNVQNPTRGSVTPAMAGTYTVTGTDANGCSNTATVTVVVTPNIVMNAGSNSPVCEGSTLNLTSDPGGLQSYSWAGPAGYTDNVQNPTRTPVTLAMAGTYTVTGTDAAGCTGTATVTVVVNPQPPVTANSNSPVCEGQTLNLTSSGATTYSWTGPNGFVSSDQNPVLTPATLAMAGTYTVVGTDGNGCTNTATVDVVINALPIVTAGSNSPVCEGQTLNLTSGPNGLTTYSWTGPNGFLSGDQNPILTPVTPAMAGTYIVTGTDGNGCSNTASVTVVVTPNIVMNAGSNSPVCVGSTLNLTSDPGGLQSYSWAGPGGFTDNVQNPTRTPVTLAMAGTYTVTGTDAAGCTGTATVTVVVNPQPPVTASSNSPVCEGQTLNLTSSGATTYSWTGPNGFVSSDQNPILTPATLAMAGTYTVIGTDGNGCTNTATVDVVINALPIVTAGSNSPVCEGQTLNLTSGPNGLDTYSWAGPGGFTDNVQNPTRGSVTPAMAGTYTVTGTDANGCSNTATVTVVVTPNIVMNAGSNSPVCVGSTLNLTSTPNGLTGYSWAGPGGFTDNVQNPTRTPVTLAMAGTYTVTGTDAAGCTGTATVTVVVNPQPNVTASSNSPVCERATLNLSSMPNGLTGYLWAGPGGFSDNVQNPTRNNATPAMSGTYTVTGTDANGCTNTATVVVTINPDPNPTATANPNPVCQTLPVTLTANSPVPGTTFSWMPGNLSGQVVTDNPNITTTYTLTARTPAGCTNTTSILVSVFPKPNQPFPTGSTTVCRTTSTNYSTPAQPGVNYTWTSNPAGPIINKMNLSGSDVRVDWNVPVGVYTLSVTGSQNGCLSDIATIIVTVTDVPVQPGIISGATSLCPGGSDNYTIAVVPNTLNYIWSVSPSAGVVFQSPQGNTNMDLKFNQPGTYTVSVIPSNACGNGQSQTLTVTVNPIPPQPVIVQNTNRVCGGQMGAIYSVQDIPGTIYNWTVPVGASIASGQGTNQISVNWVNNIPPGNYTITVTPTRLGCTGPSVSMTVSVSDPAPARPGNIVGNTLVCTGTTETYTISPVPTADDYLWTVSSPGIILTGQGTPSISVSWLGVPTGTYTVGVIARNFCGQSAQQTLQVNVIEIPTQPLAISTPPYHCVGASQTYSVPPVLNATSYTWTNSCGWQGVSTTNTINYIANSNSPCIITVVANNSCGTSPATSVFVTSIDVPPPTSPITGNNLLCQESISSYSVQNVPGLSYTWEIIPSGPSIISGQNTSSISINWGLSNVGLYTVRVRPQNVCGNGAATDFPVNLITLPESRPIMGPDVVCSGQTQTYTVASQPGASYSWRTIPIGPVITPNGNSASIQFNTQGTYVVVVEPTNQCGVGQITAFAVSVINRPVVNVNPNQVVCTSNITLVGSPVGGTWTCVSCPGGAQIASGGPYGVVTGMKPGQVNIFKYSVVAGTCPASEGFVQVINDQADPGIISGANQTICMGTQVNLSLSGNSGTIVRWEVSLDNGPFNAINNTTNNLTYTITKNSQFRVVVTQGGGCPVSFSPVANVYVTGGAIASVSPSNLTICQSTATLIGNDVPVGAVGTWSFVSGPATPNLVQSGSLALLSGMTLPGDYVYRWTIQSGNCPASSVNVTIHRMDMNNLNVGPNQTLCAETAATLTGTFVNGATITWSLMSAPMMPTFIPLGNTLNISGMTAAGNYVFRYTVDVPNCGTRYVEAYITKLSSGSIANAGPDQISCKSTTTLTGNDPSPNVGTWEFVSGPMTPIYVQNNRFLNVFNMNLGGDYYFRWKISGGECPSTEDIVKITRLPDDSAPVILSGDQSICDGTIATVQAVTPPSGTGVWSFVSGPVVASISGNGGLGSITGMTSEGLYKFRWTVTTVCGTQSKEVTISRFVSQPVGYGPAEAGSDQMLCDKAFALVAGSPIPPGFSARWEFVSGPMVASIGGVGQFGSITGMNLPGPYVFSYTIYKPGSPCPATTDVVTIIRFAPPTPAQSSSGGSICGSSGQLLGNVPLVGTGQWSFVSGPITPSLSSVAHTGTVSGMTLPGVYKFRYTISNFPCTPSAADITFTVNPGTVSGIAVGDATICGGINSGGVILTGYVGTIVRWEISEDGGVTFRSVNNQTNQMNYNNLTQTTIYRAVVKQGTCPEETSNGVTIRVVSPVVANAGPDQTICGSDVTLTGNNPSPGVGTWEFVSGPGVSPGLVQSNSTAVVSGMTQSGDYIFRYRIDGGVCPSSDDFVTVRVEAMPVAGSIAGTVTACSGSASGTLRLTGYVGHVVRWEISEDNIVYQPVNNTTSTYTYQNLTVTTYYRAVVQSGNCNTVLSNPVSVEVVQKEIAQAGFDQMICGLSVNLSGNTPVTGIGSWIYITGPSVPTIPSGNMITVNGLVAGEYIFRYQISQSPCAVSYDDVSIKVSTESIPGSVWNDRTICSSERTGTLVLTGYQGTIVRWESSTDNWLTLAVHNNPSAQYTYYNLQVPTQFRAIVKSGDCPEKASLHATVYVVPEPSIADGGNDRTICGSSIILNGNLPLQGTGSWRFLAGPGTPNLIGDDERAIISGLTTPGTYVFQYMISNPPCMPTLDNVQVTVQGVVSGGFVSGGNTVCGGLNSGLLTLTGHGGNILRWEMSTDNFVTATSIANTTTSYVYNNVLVTTQFRAIIDGKICGEIPSGMTTVTIAPASNAGVISGQNAVCSGTGTVLSVNNPVGIVVRWEYSVNGSPFAPIGNGGNTLVLNNLTQTTVYRVVVRNGSCPEAVSSDYVVTVVPASVGGTVFGGGNTVCGGSNGGTLILSGHVGNVVRWEMSTDNFATSTVINNVSNQYTYQNLNVTTSFRAVIQSGNCATAISGSTTVTVVNGNAGTLSGGASVCSGSNSGVLIISGHIGTIVRWEKSTDNFAMVTEIANTTTTQSYQNLTQNTRYRVLVSAGGNCPILISNFVEISVENQAVGGFISGSQMVCGSGNSGTLVLSGHVGNVVRWEMSTDNFATFSTISNTTTTQGYQNLTQTTYYRAVISGGICGTVNSSVGTIIVSGPGNGGILSGGNTACGSASGMLTLSGQVGNIVRWEMSTDNFVTFTPVNNTTSSLSYNLSRTTSYRVTVNSGSCGILNSNVVTIQIDSPSSGGILSSNQTVCSGLNSGVLSLSGQVGSIVRWEMSTDNFVTSTPINNQNTTYTYSNLTASTSYRVVISGTGVCPNSVSTVATISLREPMNVTATSVTGCNITGTINVSASGGQLPYTYTLIPGIQPPNQSGIFMNVPPGSYEIQVTDGAGCFSSRILTVSGSVSAPVITGVSNITTTSALVNWTPISPNGVRYNFRYRQQGILLWTTIPNLVNANVFLNGLQNNTTYEIEVSYICPNGGPTSPYSTTLHEFTTLPMGACDLNANQQPIPGGVYVDQILPRSAMVHWNLVQGAAGYIVSFGLLSQNPNSWSQYVVCNPTNFLQMNNLNANSQYGVRVRTNCSNCTTALNSNDKRSDWSRVISYQTPSNRISESELSTELRVYPNPNRGEFVLTTSGFFTGQVMYELYDGTGRLILSGENNLGSNVQELPLNVGTQSSGVYLLHIRYGQESRIVKVIID